MHGLLHWLFLEVVIFLPDFCAHVGQTGPMEDIATWMWVVGAIVTLIIMAAIVSRSRPPKKPDPENKPSNLE